MRRKIILLFVVNLFLVGGLAGFWRVPLQETTWSGVVRLSSQARAASEASMIADAYGYVHVFWSEENADTSNLILYARYDGETWSYPVDIYISGPNSPINSIAPYVDEYGTLHVIWSEGLFPKYMRYTYAPVGDALSSARWAEPRQIRIQADQVDYLVDKNGVFHVVFGMNNANGRGVFYAQSKDRAVTWTTPVWLDPDNPPELLPAKISLAFDDAGGMHAVWYYKAFEESQGDWVRYVHSLDGGKTWDGAFTIAKNSAGDDELNAFASPVMTVNGQTVHVIWAGGDLLYRHYRYSADGGATWSDTTRILGDLNGQAGDGLITDSLGRPHYFAQIRFPVGIYHSHLEENKWTFPELIYFIRFSNSDKIENRIEAHATYPVILLGNQVILTFTDPPPDDNRGLYVMTTILKDAPPVAPVTPLPPVQTATPESGEGVTVQPEGTAVPTEAAFPTPTTFPGDTSVSQVGSVNMALVWGMVVSFLLVAGVLVFRQFGRG